MTDTLAIAGGKELDEPSSGKQGEMGEAELVSTILRPLTPNHKLLHLYDQAPDIHLVHQGLTEYVVEHVGQGI